MNNFFKFLSRSRRLKAAAQSNGAAEQIDQDQEIPPIPTAFDATAQAAAYDGSVATAQPKERNIGASRWQKGLPWSWRFIRLSIKEQTMFVKRLSFLIRAGVPILESLRMVRFFRSKSKNLMFDQIISDVENGHLLSTGLDRFRYIFGDFAVNIIRVGESVGILDQNLMHLAEELRKKQELRRKIIGSLVYPAFIVVASLGIITLLLTYVFPKVLPIFLSLKMSLPWSTRFLIAASDWTVKYGFYAFFGFFVAFLIFWVLRKKSERVRLAVDRLILKLAFVGTLVQNYQLTNFCRTFGLLLKSGVTVSESSRILAESTGNWAYKKEYEILTKNMAKGQKISSQLANNKKLFPEIAVQMIATGEHSGNLSETLIYLSEMYESEVDELTKNLSNAIEPFLMVGMGVLVGFIAISIIMPIYQVTQNLHP